MIEFLLRVHDNGQLDLFKLSDGEIITRNVRTDPTFEAAHMQVDDRIDLHVDTTVRSVDAYGNQATKIGVRRMVSVSLFDDEVPTFTSAEEAQAWLDARGSR